MRKILLSIIITVTIFLGSFTLASTFTPEAAKMIAIFAETLQKIQKEYVKEKTYMELIESALSGVLSSLDPHSGYMNKKEFDEMKVNTEGEFGGIGVEIIPESGGLRIISPIDDTPAYNAGVKEGDFIIAVDGLSILDLKPDEAISKIRGKKGTKVRITVKRNNNTFEFDLLRDTIVVTPVKYHMYGNIAYIRISSFTNQTTSELLKALKQTNANNKVKGYVVDLRNNPGGLLDQAIKVSEIFINEQGKNIVSIKGRNPKDNNSFMTSKVSGIGQIPLIVLINGGSASGSEIVAGALQDHKKAILLGTKTFGKGSVQTITAIRDLGAIRMTTAIYYTPSGKSIQAEGIIPDIIVEPAIIEQLNNKKEDISESKLNGHLKNESSKGDTEVWKEIVKLKKNQWENLYKKDYQLSRALDLLESLAIFGIKNENISR